MAEPRPDRSVRRILVAEDDDTMRTVLVEALREKGFEVLEAANGRELFWSVEQASRDRPVDLVVADIRMPVYSGLDVVEAWKGTGGPQVVLITAFADPEVDRRSQRLGVPVLGKPFEIDRLVALVREQLGDGAPVHG
jgi:CheY-like chemotaxis protein